MLLHFSTVFFADHIIACDIEKTAKFGTSAFIGSLRPLRFSPRLSPVF
jgi:hypothetical protein